MFCKVAYLSLLFLLLLIPRGAGLSNPLILMVHNHAKYSNYSQRDGCFLGS